MNLQYNHIREFDYYGPSCRDANGQGIDEATWKKVHDRFSEPRVILGIQPVHGAIEAIHLLQNSFEIHFATTRLPNARIATIEWLNDQGMASRRPYSLHFVPHREKHTVLCRFSAIIDDDPVQAALFSELGLRSIVLAHPWNQGSDAPVERANSWDEIVELLGRP